MTDRKLTPSDVFGAGATLTLDTALRTFHDADASAADRARARAVLVLALGNVVEALARDADLERLVIHGSDLRREHEHWIVRAIKPGATDDWSTEHDDLGDGNRLAVALGRALGIAK